MIPISRIPVGPIDPLSPQSRARQIRRRVLLLLGYYNVALHAGVVRYARDACWAINDHYVRIGSPPLWWRGDGIIGLITHPKDVRALELYPNLPIVDVSKGWISESMPEKDRILGIGKPRVYYDNENIARLSAEHFLQRGFKHIAYLNMGNYWLDVERIPAIRHRVEKAGAAFHEIEFHLHLSTAGSNPLEAHVAALAWLSRKMSDLPKPLGVITPSDEDAARLLQVCDDCDLAIPEEVCILGCDNDPLVCLGGTIPLSSVDNDWDRIGYEAAGLLDRIMDGEAPPSEPLLIPPKGVVTRLSTNILAIPDPLVARSLRFIWENFTHQIGTTEVAASAGLNRRKLERDFRSYLGCTVADEIMRVRIECAKRLLLDTDMKVHQIAEESGFSGPTPFSNAFVRVTGMRPGGFRNDKPTAK